jgi:hypothetical protein
MDKSRSVSPTIAVILLIGVTLLLSVTIGLTVTNTQPDADTAAATSQLSIQTTQNESHLSIKVISGETDALIIQKNETTLTTVSSPAVGETVTAGITPDARYTVISKDSKSTRVLFSQIVTQAKADEGTEPSQIPTDQLYAHYTIEESTVSSDGEILYDTVGTSDGDIIGATLTSGRNGSKALEFNSSDKVDIGRFNQSNGDSLTISTWVYVTESQLRDGKTNYIQRYDGTSAVTLGIVDNADQFHQVRFQMRDNETGKWMKAATPTDNVTAGWHHLVGVAESGEKLKLYIDGVKYTKDPYGRGAIGETRLEFPENYTIGTKLDSRVDSVRVYRSALNSSEVRALYNATK